MFFVIEGTDGSGKTTVVEGLHRTWRSHSVMGKEPVDNLMYGEMINECLQGLYHIDDRTLASMFADNRHEHMIKRKRIIEHEKYFLFCDRYLISSLVYQPGREISYEEVWRMNSRFPIPHLTVFIDTHPSICARRIKRRGMSLQKFETRISEYRDKYVEVCKKLSTQHSWPIARVNGNVPKEELLKSVIGLVRRRIEQGIEEVEDGKEV